MAAALKAGDRVTVIYEITYNGGLLATAHLRATVASVSRTKAVVLFDPPTPFVGEITVERSSVRKVAA